MSELRDLPSVDQLLQTQAVHSILNEYGHPLTVDAIRDVLGDVRARFSIEAYVPEQAELLERVQDRLKSWTASTIIPVINATGVVLHTNLGRAPLSRAAIQAVHDVALGYSTLEFDLERGKRGSRMLHAESLLCRITGAEAAMVVNNNAAAVMLVLIAFARRRAVVIARSQLVEIGGGFRVPDVMKQSGARLVEIGTTNRVHLSDYEAALEEKPALILRAHRSNFTILGFTSEPELAEISDLAHRAGILMADDLGSGALLDTARFGLAHEPTVLESLSSNVDLVCFSGDKLLGGPQAGIIVGRSDLIAKLKRHPLARAIRADKLCLAALSATLIHYIKDEVEREIPIWRMIASPVEDLHSRAQAWGRELGQGEVLSGESTVGGGSLPGETLPTNLLALSVDSPNRALDALRQGSPPIIARLQDERLVFDPRTVLPEQDQALASGIRAILSHT